VSAQVLYHGFDRVTDLVGHGKSIEAAAAACPLPPGPVQRDTPPWQGMHAAFVRELRAAEDAGVSDSAILPAAAAPEEARHIITARQSLPRTLTSTVPEPCSQESKTLRKCLTECRALQAMTSALLLAACLLAAVATTGT